MKFYLSKIVLLSTLLISGSMLKHLTAFREPQEQMHLAPHITTSNGLSATSRTNAFGTTYHNYSNGMTATSRTNAFGTTHHNYSNGVSGSSRTKRFGTTYHNYSNGVSGSSRTNAFGTTYHNYSNGMWRDLIEIEDIRHHIP